MSTQEDIHAAGSENRPPMLNKENYVPWSSRLLRYSKSRPNGKLIYNSIMNGPYVRRMIPEPGDADREVPVNETFLEQTDDELTEKELKQVEANDQSIQTIPLGLPEDIYAVVDSCETTQEVWLRVQQIMKGSDIGIQEKKAKLFNEWEMFTSTDGESIESYYHRFSKLMNDFKRNKHFPEKIASNLKFLNNLQPEWSRNVTIVHQTKDLHTSDYTQLYDFLKYNQKEVDDLRVKRLAKTHDPLALIANSNNPFNYPVFHQDQPSSSTYMQQPLPNNNNYNPQPSVNQNYMQQPMPNPEDITYPTTAMNMTLVLMDKAFKLNYSTPTNNNQIISSNPCNRQIAQSGMKMGQDRQVVQNAVQNPGVQNVRNQNGLIVVLGIANQNPNRNGNVVVARAEGNAIENNGNQIRCYNYRGLGHLARNCTVRPRRMDAAYLQTQLLIAQKEDAGIQLQAKEFDLMAATTDLDEIEKVNANCILMANLQQASTSGTQTDKAPVYDSVGSAKVSSVEQSEGTVVQHPTTVEGTHAYFESLYNNLSIEVEKVNTVNPQQKQQSLYNGKVLLEKHDPPTMYDSDETLQLAQESRLKMKQLNKEIKPANYIKINHLLGVFVSQTAKLREELYFSNTSKMANVSKPISIPNEEFSDDTTPSGAQKFLNEIHKIVKDEIFPIINQVNARLKNIKIQFLKEAAKFVRDFKSIPKEVNESLAKHKALELEIKRLLRAVFSQDIMSIVQSNYVIDKSNLQTELDHTKERFENCIIKKENEYAKLWNDWHKKCEECKYDKISYDKVYNDMQQKIERLQAQLGDQKGKSKDTPRVFEQKDTTKGTSVNTQFCKQSILGKPPSSSGSKLYVVTPFPKSKGLPKIDKTHALSKPVTSNSVPTPQESKVVNNDKVIAPGMFRINPFKPSREEKYVPNKVRASVRTNPITVSQPHVITKKDVNSDSNGLSSTGVDNTAKTRRPQPRSNTKNDRVPSASKSSCSKNKEVEVEEHPRNLLLSKNKKHMSSECNNVKLAIQNDKSKVVCAIKQKANVSNTENQKKQKPKVMKPKKVGSNERLASPKPSKPRSCLRWSPTRRLFDLKGKIIASSESESQSDCSNGDNACTSNPSKPTIKRFPNSTSFLGRLSKFVYDLEVAFRRNTCFVRNLEGVDLLKGNRTTNLYTINLHEMAYASPICLMTRATSTKSWLWHQRLSHFNFDTINDLDRNDLVTGLPKFKYHKEHLCPSCEQGKSKRESLPLKPVPNSKQRLHLLHMDLCGPKKITSINGKRYVLVIVDDYSHYTWTPTTANTAPTPTNSSSQAKNLPNTSQDVDELETQQQHVQQQENQAQLQPKIVAVNVPNAMLDENTFVNPFATPSTSAAESSSSQYMDPLNMHMFYQPYPHEYRWTKDHPRNK
ncbi:retrovirus-related pol polyprotein from transposon TNT 1-94 [Tanacetum coccineum]